MKRLFFLISMLMTCIGYINADEIVVPNIVVPQGGTATLDIQLNNEQQIRTEVQFLITLPEGITLVHNSSKIGERFNGMAVAPGDTPEGNTQWTVMISAAGATAAPIPGNTGTLVTVDLQADESIEYGTELYGCLEITDMNLLSGGSFLDDIQSKVNFKITIGEQTDGRTILDENSTFAPTAADGVDVRVKRTIKANQWSTICLPFAMTEAQVKAAFGDDVKVGDFTGCEVEESTGNIKVNFSSVTAMEANHPYIIKVSSPITEFLVDEVDVAPVANPVVLKDKKRTTYNSFVGTYVAETEIPDYALFISGNQFWFSTGNTKMKAFRAYFDLATAGAVYEPESARMVIAFEEETTGLDAIENRDQDASEYSYDLLGRREPVQPTNRVIIKNGKKVIIK